MHAHRSINLSNTPARRVATHREPHTLARAPPRCAARATPCQHALHAHIQVSCHARAPLHQLIKHACTTSCYTPSTPHACPRNTTLRWASHATPACTYPSKLPCTRTAPSTSCYTPSTPH